MAGAEKTDRRNQPRCGFGVEPEEGCSHPISFHGGGTSNCRALGCTCPAWVEPLAEPADAEG